MDEPNVIGAAHLRVARPTDDLDAVVRFYRDGLGFEVLYEFADHDGFDGAARARRGGVPPGVHRKVGHRAGIGIKKKAVEYIEVDEEVFQALPEQEVETTDDPDEEETDGE
jgi:catechol 2,3-dioxygenase-like lactoylglutathione lyase family enzyme